MIEADGRLLLEPIGFFRSSARRKLEAPRQASLDRSDSEGVVELLPGRGFELALCDLEGFERAWLLYGFHLSSQAWKPLTTPPRGPRVKRGAFATRTPYRPNPLGLSCVRLAGVEGLLVRVLEHDVLDGSPVYDIKPYVPYADAFPGAAAGWIDEIETGAARVEFAPEAEERLAWLEARGLDRLRPFLQAQLAWDPLDRKRKRVRKTGTGDHEIAYRTWRAEFRVDERGDACVVTSIRSGFSEREVARGEPDRYGDLALHREFRVAYPPNEGVGQE